MSFFASLILSVLKAITGEKLVLRTGFFISTFKSVYLFTFFSTKEITRGLETAAGRTFKYKTDGIAANTAAAHITPPKTLIFFFILSSIHIIS